MKRKPLDEVDIGDFDLSPFTADEVADMYLRADLTVTLGDHFRELKLPYDQIGKLLDIAQQWVIDLMDGKAEKFSSEELLEFCSRAGITFDPFTELQWN
jgi:predicted XRE-type DNA-binding protein